MATEAECREAVDTLLGRLSDVDPNLRKKRVPDRTISVTVLDHDLTWVGDLKNGELINVHLDSSHPKTQIRMVLTSDVLVALTNGDETFSHAWATGKLRLDASLRDLVRLRNLN